MGIFDPSKGWDNTKAIQLKMTNPTQHSTKVAKIEASDGFFGKIDPLPPQFEPNLMYLGWVSDG